MAPDVDRERPGAILGGADRLQVVLFEVGNRPFAIDVMDVDEVIQPRSIGPVPGQPAFVEGLFELRGRYLPLIDLRRRFGLSKTVGAAEKVIVARCTGRALGLLVDRVGEVDRFSRAELVPTPLETAIGGVAPCRGVVHRDGQMVLVLDANKLLSPDELALVPGEEAVS